VSTLIHHSGIGVQHASKEFQALLKINDILCSIIRKGNYWDNPVAESFLHTFSCIEKKHSSFAFFMFVRGIGFNNA
jgi:transposase InsO family protein